MCLCVRLCTYVCIWLFSQALPCERAGAWRRADEIKTDLHAGDTISGAFSTKIKWYGLKQNMRAVGCAFSQVKMNQGAIISQTKTLTVAIYFKTTQVSWRILSPFTPNDCKTHHKPRSSILSVHSATARPYLGFTGSLVQGTRCIGFSGGVTERPTVTEKTGGACFHSGANLADEMKSSSR